MAGRDRQPCRLAISPVGRSCLDVEDILAERGVTVTFAGLAVFVEPRLVRPAPSVAPGVLRSGRNPRLEDRREQMVAVTLRRLTEKPPTGRRRRKTPRAD